MLRGPSPLTIRWLGRSITEKKYYTIHYSCDDKQHIFGTGFIVNKHIRSRVIDFKPTDRRMCVLRMRRKYKKL
jgi:hypothetical protein